MLKLIYSRRKSNDIKCFGPTLWSLHCLHEYADIGQAVVPIPVGSACPEELEAKKMPETDLEVS